MQNKCLKMGSRHLVGLHMMQINTIAKMDNRALFLKVIYTFDILHPLQMGAPGFLEILNIFGLFSEIFNMHMNHLVSLNMKVLIS